MRRHRVFVVLLALGTTLRVVTQLAYVPALLYIDSFGFLENTAVLDPSGPRPIGYNLLLLRWLLPLGDLALIPFVQHLLGLAVGALIYTLLVHLRVRPWLAAVAAAPALLDGYVLQIEQNVMSDALFVALVVAALALLAWRREPAYPAVALAGLLFGLAGSVRLVGLPLLLVGLVH
ncbi:MAG: phospholipid carrier-dependent glycosyltransferase, partial [Egibacteraceae bacterium]